MKSKSFLIWTEYKGNKTYVKKLRSGSGTWFAFAVILIVPGIAFTIGWASRGPRIHDFTGIGEAKILTMKYISQGHGDRSDDRFVFDIANQRLVVFLEELEALFPSKAFNRNTKRIEYFICG